MVLDNEIFANKLCLNHSNLLKRKRKENEDLIDSHGDVEAWITKILFVTLNLDGIQFASILSSYLPSHRFIRYSVSNRGLILLRAQMNKISVLFTGKTAKEQLLQEGYSAFKKSFRIFSGNTTITNEHYPPQLLLRLNKPLKSIKTLNMEENIVSINLPSLKRRSCGFLSSLSLGWRRGTWRGSREERRKF